MVLCRSDLSCFLEIHVTVLEELHTVGVQSRLSELPFNMQEQSRRPDHTEGLLFREVSVDLNGGQLASEPHHQGGETLEQPTQGFGIILETQVQWPYDAKIWVL